MVDKNAVHAVRSRLGVGGQAWLVVGRVRLESRALGRGCVSCGVHVHGGRVLEYRTFLHMVLSQRLTSFAERRAAFARTGRGTGRGSWGGVCACRLQQVGLARSAPPPRQLELRELAISGWPARPVRSTASGAVSLAESRLSHSLIASSRS